MMEAHGKRSRNPRAQEGFDLLPDGRRVHSFAFCSLYKNAPSTGNCQRIAEKIRAASDFTTYPPPPRQGAWLKRRRSGRVATRKLLKCKELEQWELYNVVSWLTRSQIRILIKNLKRRWPSGWPKVEQTQVAGSHFLNP